MSDQSPPLPPPDGYDSWLDYATQMIDVRELMIDGSRSDPECIRYAARAELALLKEERDRLRAALESILQENEITGKELRDFAAEALKGLE